MRGGWSSRVAFIVALVASAVGLGNIWRFPYLLLDFGGAFFVFYVALAFVLGVPLIYIELSLAERFREPLRDLFNKKLSIKHLYLPSAILIFTISSYYSVVTAKALTSALSFLALPFLDVLAWLFVWSLGIYALFKGISAIEKLNDVFMGLLIILLLYLFFSTVDFGKLPALWQLKAVQNHSLLETFLVAISQVLFSLSVGAGMTYTYAGYMHKRFNPWHIAFIVALADTTIAVLSAFVVFSFVGNSTGVFVAFSALSKALMSAGGLPLLFLFFLALFSAGITSFVAELKLVKDNLTTKGVFLSLFVSLLTFIIGSKAVEFLDKDIVGNAFLPLMLVNMGVFIYLLYFHKGAKGKASKSITSRRSRKETKPRVAKKRRKKK